MNPVLFWQKLKWYCQTKFILLTLLQPSWCVLGQPKDLIRPSLRESLTKKVWNGMSMWHTAAITNWYPFTHGLSCWPLGTYLVCLTTAESPASAEWPVQAWPPSSQVEHHGGSLRENYLGDMKQAGALRGERSCSQGIMYHMGTLSQGQRVYHHRSLTFRFHEILESRSPAGSNYRLEWALGIQIALMGTLRSIL